MLSPASGPRPAPGLLERPRFTPERRLNGGGGGVADDDDDDADDVDGGFVTKGLVEFHMKNSSSFRIPQGAFGAR